MNAIIRFSGEHRFLSNFYPALLKWDGLHWRSIEHAFQGMKTLNATEREYIRQARSPGAAKYLGRQCSLRPDWEQIKVELMRDLLKVKFEIPELRQQLLATGDAEIIEGNTWGDRFWGQCPVGCGENMLGVLLMQVRAEARG